MEHLIIQVAPVLLGEGVQREGERRFCLEQVKKYGPFAELVYSREGALPYR